MIVTVPVCSVIVPEKAAAKSEDVPARAVLGVFSVIVPVVAEFIVFN